jgi:hypothetical protein
MLAGVPTYIFGTEQSAEVLGVKQACVDLQIPARLILKPEDEDIASGRHEREKRRVMQRVDSMGLDGHLINYCAAPYLSRDVVREWTRWAVVTEAADTKVPWATDPELGGAEL